MTKKRQEAVQTERTLVEQTAIEQPKANVKYKDTIFRMLFSEPEHLLSLYNAVTGKDYRDPDALNVVTLENAVYMGMKNDLAFVLEMGMYLYEHQSTYNPNIPLRDLFYIASEYQKLVDEKSLYSSGIQKIPTPNFLVFYNGTDRDVPDRTELRLSDAFENPMQDPALELKVTMLNINAGHNEELMNSCHVLQEYARYVARVRKYVAEMPLDEAVERAVTECIREGILAEFLKKNRAEVVKVSIFEYDKEKEEKKKLPFVVPLQKNLLVYRDVRNEQRYLSNEGKDENQFEYELIYFDLINLASEHAFNISLTWNAPKL